MINLYSYIQNHSLSKKFEVDELLFVEYKCVVEETKAGIWSELNYFVFVTSGKKMWRSIENDYVVEAGDSLFVRKGANLVHQYFEEDYCALMVFIPDDFILKFMQRYHSVLSQQDGERPDCDAVIRITMDTFLNGYIDSLAALFGGQASPDKTLLRLKFEELLLNIFTRSEHREVARYLSSLSGGQSSHLEQIMESNYTYNIKLEEFASLCNMSLSSFKRMFNSVYKTPPGKWLSEKRLNHSVQLLRTTDKTINEITFESGFENSSSFIRSFKSKFNCTPLQYRNTSD